MFITEPEVYKEFVCTASKCPMTCCQEWKIAVDKATKCKWKEKNLNAISDNSNAIIAFCDDGKCPYLNKDELCDIVIKFGDEMIPKACQVFPREEHRYMDRVEKALTPGCPAVLDLLWNKDTFETNTVEEASADFDDEIALSPVLFKLRDWLMENIKYGKVSNDMALKINFLILLDMIELEENNILEENFELYKEKFDIDEVINALAEVDLNYERFNEYNELFLDIIQEYYNQGMYLEFLDDIKDMAENFSDRDLTEEYKEFIGELSDWKKYFNILLCEEIYSSLLTDGVCCVKDMTIKFQWMIIEYVVILHSLFLRKQKGVSLSHENIRECVCTMFRIMGFADEDIFEYMGEMFEESVWAWGYFSFVL